MAESTSGERTSLVGLLEEIPADFIGTVKNGFMVVSSLAKRDQQRAVELIVGQLESTGGSVESEAIVEAIGIESRDASRLVAAISVTVGLLTESSASAEEFVDTAAGRLFDAPLAPMARELAEYIVAQRSSLQEAMSRDSLANSVLPSLARFDVAVDLRFKFKKDLVEDRVAVAVVNIGTDVRSQSLWLQLSRHDVQKVIEKLQETERQMAAVEGLISPPAKRA